MNDFNLRADLVANKDTLPLDVLLWLQKEYRKHTGSNRAFVRRLVIELHDEKVTQKEKMKREIIEELLEKIGTLDIDDKQKVEEGLKELDDDQVDTQNSMLSQFD